MLTREKLVEQFNKQEIFPLGIWHDSLAGYQRRKDIIINFLLKAFDSGAAGEREKLKIVMQNLEKEYGYDIPATHILSHLTKETNE